MTTATGGTTKPVDELEMTTFDVDVHCQAVADMWNASDANWPGTWTGGVPETAEAIRKSYLQQETLETFLCMDGEVAAGFCKVMPDPEEPGADYVALVNVPPSHQKRGVARRLLQRAMDFALERGSKRIDLHTWSANLNAVPLYKKVGFMWMPDTGGHMLNFLPAILQLDAAREFFATRDWYRVMRRELDQVPDEDRWEGMKVFTYRFADSPDAPADAEPALVVRVDREARAICAVDTNSYSVAATADRLEPARGGAVTMRWTVTNKGQAPLPVTVIASGNEELLIDFRGSVEIAPGATEIVEASCRIAPDAKDVKGWKPAPAVKSLLLLGDEVVELSTGLRYRPALEIKTWPAHITLLPGERRTVQIRLRNRVAGEVDVDLRAAGGDGLGLSWTSQQLKATGEGWCGTELEVTVPAGRSAAYPLALSATSRDGDNTLRVEPDPRHVFAVAPGALVSAREKEMLRIENDQLRAFLTERGGRLVLMDPDSGSGRGGSSAVPGPPFSPSEFHTLEYDLEFHHDGGVVEATATAKSKRWDGFVFRRRIRFSSSPVVELCAELENNGTESRRIQFMQGASGRGGGSRVLPLTSGLRTGENWTDFPGGDDDLIKQPASWAERWAAGQGRDGWVTGLVWGTQVEEIRRAGQSVLTTAELLEPQSRVAAEPMWMYCGPGTWRAVRDLWRRREGLSTPRDLPPVEPIESLTAGSEPEVWIAGSGPVKLMVESGHTWPVGGKATLVAPAGWSIDRSEVDLSETTWQKAGVTEVDLTAPGGRAAAGMLRIELRGTETDKDLEVPVIAFADAAPPTVETREDAGRALWSIKAGPSEVTVAPDHAGSTVSWKVDGVEQLASPYPETAAVGWLLPWHGGITPIFIMGEVEFPGKMWTEEFSSEEVEEKDSRGLLWRGVTVSATSSHEESRGMRLEASTLACAGAPVLKSVVRLHNTSGALQIPTFGSMVFCAPGGDRANTHQHSEGLASKPSDRYIFHTAATWVAAVNGESGAALLMTSDRELEVAKFGADGGHVINLRSPEVQPGGTAESVSYLVAAESLEAALPWKVLSKLR